MNPKLREEYDAVLYNSSEQLLEQLRTIPDLEPNIQRARLKVDAIRQYLELRWPTRYGKRLELTVKHADMSKALTAGRERARPARLERGVVVDVSQGADGVWQDDGAEVDVVSSGPAGLAGQGGGEGMAEEYQGDGGGD